MPTKYRVKTGDIDQTTYAYSPKEALTTVLGHRSENEKVGTLAEVDDGTGDPWYLPTRPILEDLD